MATGYEVVQETIERFEGSPPYDPQWIAVEAPVGKYVVNWYALVDGLLRFDMNPWGPPRLVTDGSGRVTRGEFLQAVYDPPNDNHGQDYDVYLICVDG